MDMSNFTPQTEREQKAFLLGLVEGLSQGSIMEGLTKKEIIETLIIAIEKNEMPVKTPLHPTFLQVGGEDFYCPQCHSSLFLPIGEEGHYKCNNCPQEFSGS